MAGKVIKNGFYFYFLSIAGYLTLGDTTKCLGCVNIL